MEIIRNGELQELIDVINTNPYGKILISGNTGSGKTFLLNTIGKILEERGSKIIYGVSAFSHINSKALNDYYDIENVVYLVDGLDETFRYKHIVDRIKNNRGCWICTARNNIFDIKFDYEIELKALTNEQTLLLINDYLGFYFSSEDVIKEIFRGIGEESVIPRILTEKLYSKLNAEGINKYFLGLKTDIHQLYTYGGGLSLQHPEIIVPERKIIKVPNEIKQDINVVTRSLLDKVALKPDILREITPRQFEELICELFERKGYNVQLTKQTRDGGKDLIILNNSILGDLMIYAECKKYSPKHPVNVGLVRELYGTVEADRATARIMVTTSHFSTDARRFQQQIKGRMNLIDYSELMNQIMDCR